MPRGKSFKSLLMEVIMFLGMIALVGHLSMSFWERFIIHTEISKMKTSLYTLKETVHKIDYAYDNLHREFIGLAEKTENKHSLLLLRQYVQAPQRTEDHDLNKKVVNDMPSQEITKTKNHTPIATDHLNNKTTHNQINKRKKQSPQLTIANNNKVISENVSTMTKNPLKSTGVGLDVERNKSDFIHLGYCKNKTETKNNIHNCRTVYHYAYMPYDKNWKF